MIHKHTQKLSFHRPMMSTQICAEPSYTIYSDVSTKRRNTYQKRTSSLDRSILEGQPPHPLHLSSQKPCTEHIDRWPQITLGCHMFPRSSHRSASCWTNGTSSFWDRKKKSASPLFAKCFEWAPDLVLRCSLSESKHHFTLRLWKAAVKVHKIYLPVIA